MRNIWNVLDNVKTLHSALMESRFEELALGTE